MPEKQAKTIDVSKIKDISQVTPDVDISQITDVNVLKQFVAAHRANELTPEQIDIVKYADNNEDKVVDSDDYTPAELAHIDYLEENKMPLGDEYQKVKAGKTIDNFDYVATTIIHGQNDLFVKHYNFKEDDVSFDISIKEPNISEEGQILAYQSQMLLGLNGSMSDYWNSVFYGLALIRVCGKSVPMQLEKDENIHAPQYPWLATIANDFLEWEARFRR